MATLSVKDHRQLHRLVDEIYCQADAKKLSWAKLAKKSGVSARTVQRLGTYTTRFPRAQTVWELARAVGIKISIGET